MALLIGFQPLVLKICSPVDRDGVAGTANLVLAPLLILIKLISSLFQGSNRGIHYWMGGVKGAGLRYAWVGRRVGWGELWS